MKHLNIAPENHVPVLGGQGWVGLIDNLGDETTIVNAARVSFGKIKDEMDERDITLLEYLIENRHTSPLEHLVFTFSIHCPLFVRGQWHRHRTWSYNEISRRYTEVDMEFYTPTKLRTQAKIDRQASVEDADFDDAALCQKISDHNQASFKVFDQVYALTGGGPGRATQVVSLNIYMEAFAMRSRYGYASAKAIILFVTILLITGVQLIVMKRKEVEM